MHYSAEEYKTRLKQPLHKEVKLHSHRKAASCWDGEVNGKIWREPTGWSCRWREGGGGRTPALHVISRHSNVVEPTLKSRNPSVRVKRRVWRKEITSGENNCINKSMWTLPLLETAAFYPLMCPHTFVFLSCLLLLMCQDRTELFHTWKTPSSRFLSLRCRLMWWLWAPTEVVFRVLWKRCRSDGRKASLQLFHQTHLSAYSCI